MQLGESQAFDDGLVSVVLASQGHNMSVAMFCPEINTSNSSQRTSFESSHEVGLRHGSWNPPCLGP